MQKVFLKSISMLLVLVLLVNMLPMSVFAEEFQDSIANAESPTEENTTESVTEDAYVVGEIKENRTEYSKEFLMSNGLHMATVYADAVHYETENGWEEIDNTLKINADGTYSNTAGVWDVTFPEQLGENKSVTIKKDGYTLSFSMSGALTAGGPMVMSAMLEDTPLQTFGVTDAQPAIGEIRQLDTTAMLQAAEHPETVPDKLQSQIAYAEVYENTDIVYDLDSNKVKESMILESYDAELQGYSYTLEVGTMIPVLGEDGSVTLYDENQENIVMVMPAPYLIDDAGEHNYDIEVQLIGKGSTYTLFYLLPQDWLAAEDRAWPVVLDPMIEGDTAARNIQDRTVAENATYAYNDEILETGYTVGTGVHRAFLKYETLPCITSSDVVVYATMNLYKMMTSDNEVIVEAHKVTGNWTSKEITWTSQPAYEDAVEDYLAVREQGYYSWIVTDIVRDWYATANNGLMFKACYSAENAGTNNYKQFASSDLGSAGTKPVLHVYFRNNNGLESYWDYTSSSAGRAGTGYINNFTGNLTWVREDIGFGGNRMPVSISHIYNLNDAIIPSDSNNSNDSGGNGFGMGIGWRTNFNQLVYQWNVNSNYYVWEDSDGTDHYFKHESGSTYKDEDGLELTLTTNGSGTEKYCITDKNGNQSYFDTQGRLTKQINNQATKSSINIAYKNATSRLISKITDGVGRKYDFTYTGDLLTRISYKGSGSTELSYVAFGYSGSKLTTVTDKDNKVSTYTYDGNLLKTASDIDGYKLTYTYSTPSQTWQPYRVKSVAESDGNTPGGSLTFSYAHNETTITDYNGNVEIYQFNDFGNTVSIQDDEGHATFAQYARTDRNDTAGKANQLKVSSKLQNTVGNRVRYSNFEGGEVWGVWPAGTSCQNVTTDAYIGNHSLLFTATEWSCLMSDVFMIGRGETYTFSAYVKGVSGNSIMMIVDTNGVNGAQLAVTSGATEWKRVEVSYTNTSGSDLFFRAQFFATAGSQVYIDGVQVERAPTASRYNLVENGDFIYNTGWTMNTNTRVTETSAVALLDNTVCRMVGAPANWRSVYQYIPVSGSAGDTYVLAGWAKGDSAPLTSAETDANIRRFCLKAIFHNTDGSKTERVVSFNPDCPNIWQYVSSAVIADKAYSSIQVAAVYDYNVNTVYFDGIQLFKEEFGSSYTYDDEGNVTAVKDLQGQTTTYEYDTNSNLTKIIQNNKAKMTYTYDNWHNVETATTEEGLVYNFVYDDYGNNTEVSITSNGMTMRSEACYIDPNDDSSLPDGNYLVYTKDALGKVTTYGYNPQTGVLEWVQYPEDTADTRTEYTYDSMYRMATAACETDTGLNLSAEYTYTDDLLTKIETPSTTYNFTYGDFDLRTGVSIGSRTLATYHYTDEAVNDRKYDLDRLDYGNGDKVQYEYDDKGRTTKQTYEDGDTVTYSYDNDGALAKVYDSQSGITTKYFYDLTGRQMKYTESGTGYSHSIGYEYDTRNNLTKQIETTNGTTSTTTYTYDDDNRVKTSTTNGITVEYDYDSFGRIETQTTKNGSTVVLTESYTYKAPTSTATSAQIATYTTTTPNGYSVTYSYTYDNNGNILSVSDGTHTTSYVYDSANQLIRENNQAGNFTHTWTYDSAGNILNRKEYAYTTGSLEGVTPTDTVTYTYGNSDWGDLLTAYDGSTITYDQIGNPLTDGTWTYTWQHGRQLASLSKGGNNYSYAYNEDGQRIQKTLNGTVHTFYYSGDKVIREEYSGNVLELFYDAAGRPTSFKYNGVQYYYVTNQQGDIIKILDSSGNVQGSYTYDAWGNTTSISGTATNYNPLRYRGYFFDAETGFYYVSSRYYDPEIGRFINADSQLNQKDGILGYNMFAYCHNNPIMYSDPTGHSITLACIIIGAVIGAVAGGCAGAYVSKKQTGKVNGWAVAAGAVGGGVVGGLVGWGVGAAITAVGAAATGSAATAAAPVVQQVAEKASTALQTYYPPNDGFSGAVQKITLEAGTLIQRTGDLVGRYIAPAGTPTQMLSLPYDKIGQPTTILQVQQSVEVLAGRVAPWFGQIGGGIQYQLGTPLDQLISEGIIKIFGG